MRRGRHAAGEAAVGEQVGELYGGWIAGALEVDVNVANDEDRFDERITAMCCQSNITFLIFAVLVV